MGLYHGRNCKFYVGGYDIGAMVMAATPSMAVANTQVAVMDGSGGYRTIKGAHDDNVTLDALLDDNYMTALDNIRLTSTGSQVIIPFGVTQGDQGLACAEAVLTKYGFKAVTTDVNKLSAELKGQGCAWDTIKMLHPAATRTTTASGTAVNETAPSAAGAIGYLQIWGLGANDTLTVVIEESSDNGVADAWAALISFTVLNGVVATRTTEMKTVTGAVEQYIRVTWTFGGTAPYSASFIVAWCRN